MGDQRLRPRLRWLPPPRRPHGRPARAPPSLPQRDRALHRRVAPLRLRLERGRPDRRPRHPGPRGRGDHSRRTLDPHDHLQGRPRAEHRPWRLGRSRRLRRRGGRPARRRAHGRALVGVDLLRQRPGRRDRADRQSLPARREPGRDREALRRDRCRARHGRPQPHGAGHHPGPPVGLDVAPDDRRLRGRRPPARGIRPLGAANRGPADAVLDLPRPHRARRQHRRVHPRYRALRDVPDADALHAAGARLLADEDGRRLPGGGRDLDHLGQRRRRSSSTGSA